MSATYRPGETNLVEEHFRNDTSKMHLLWANHYGADQPAYTPHDTVGQIPDGVGGMEGHTGSPTQVRLIEDTGRTPHGAVMFDDNLSTAADKHRVLMEEIGHGLGAGYADDQLLGIGECYSGGTCYGPQDGEDRTPEAVAIGRQGEWPIMGEANHINGSRTAFSIEELSTVDFQDIPSVDD